MKPPLDMLNELLRLVRRDLYAGKSVDLWCAQQQLVKKALLYPARWLDERKVPLSAERYQQIIQGIVATMVGKGNLGQVTFMSRYLLHCVQQHMEHHGDTYYREGKAIGNRISVVMSALEKARRGDDATIPILAEAEKLLQIGKRQPKLKPVATPLHDDLFAPAKPRK